MKLQHTQGKLPNIPDVVVLALKKPPLGEEAQIKPKRRTKTQRLLLCKVPADHVKQAKRKTMAIMERLQLNYYRFLTKEQLNLAMTASLRV